ncbi:MAG: exosome complex protein Rrp42 [Candidatus Nanohalobium sp.]
MKLNQKTIREMAEGGERLDGRDFDSFRDIEVETGYIHETSEGSALVQIGDTKVLVGLSIEIEEPYSDRPEKGTIVTNAELAPMAKREYESGPPQEAGVELARVVDRGIREAEAIDLNDLCMEPGEKVYTVFIDIHVLNDDGNLIDASSLAAMAALKSGYLPAYDEEAGELNRDEKWKDIELQCEPITVTGRKIGSTLLWDTTGEEEKALDARLTVSKKKDGNVVAMQKGESEPFTSDELSQIMTEADEKIEKLREIVEEEVGE